MDVCNVCANNVGLSVGLPGRKRAILEWESAKAEKGLPADDEGDWTTFEEGTELDVAATTASIEAAAADLARRKEQLLRELAL